MNIMKPFLLFALMCLPACSSSHDGAVTFVEEASSEEQWPGKKIVLVIDEQKIGFVNYAQISSMVGWYALYELYVYPEYRNQGFAKQLLSHACETLFAHGAKKIFIQPGPFEFDAHVEEMEYAQRTQQLIKLYEEVGFVPASAWLRMLIMPYYKIAGISENPQYLMVRTK